MEKSVDVDLEFLLDLARYFYAESQEDFMLNLYNRPQKEDIVKWLESRSSK